MARLTIIVGVAGSGKSSLRREIARERRIKGFGDATLTNHDDRRRAGRGCLGELVARLLGRGEDCVMDESHLTMDHFRGLFKGFCDEFLPNVEQEWIFFENDALACINNVYHDMYVEVKDRDWLGRLKALRNQSKAYEVPPAGAYPGYQAPIRVYQQASPRFADKEEAQRWLHDEIERLSGQ